VAALLCLVPSVAIVAWANIGSDLSPERLLLVVLGGTGLRMVVVLGAGLALSFLDPVFQDMAFWIWLVVFYLITLTLEIGLLLRRNPAARGPGRSV
jgi:hypothetical protein